MVVGKRTIEMANGYSLAERKNGEYIIMDAKRRSTKPNGHSVYLLTKGYLYISKDAKRSSRSTSGSSA